VIHVNWLSDIESLGAHQWLDESGGAKWSHILLELISIQSNILGNRYICMYIYIYEHMGSYATSYYPGWLIYIYIINHIISYNIVCWYTIINIIIKIIKILMTHNHIIINHHQPPVGYRSQPLPHPRATREVEADPRPGPFFRDVDPTGNKKIRRGIWPTPMENNRGFD
jgi:hypothetical protein